MRYAGFWPRLAALLIDFVVLVPLVAVSFWTLSAPRSVAIAAELPLAAAFVFYNIWFVGRWGQTLGKMALRIRVVALDGSRAGYRRAFLRHCVDLAFSLVIGALGVLALLTVSDAEYDALDGHARLELLAAHGSAAYDVLVRLNVAWVASELVVLLLNEKRRALHDFIAGTVVVHTALGAGVSAASRP